MLKAALLAQADRARLGLGDSQNFPQVSEKPREEYRNIMKYPLVN